MGWGEGGGGGGAAVAPRRGSAHAGVGRRALGRSKRVAEEPEKRAGGALARPPCLIFSSSSSCSVSICALSRVSCCRAAERSAEAASSADSSSATLSPREGVAEQGVKLSPRCALRLQYFSHWQP